MDNLKTWQKLKADPSLFQSYFVKEYIIRAIRKFFEARKYHELESPILAPALPQEHYLNPLTVDIKVPNGKNKLAYMIPSTERYNKIILAAGLGEHFVITKVFRGLEEASPNHSPEFTMCEWYHLNADYNDLMDDCEELFIFIQKFLCEELLKKEFSFKVEYLDYVIDLTPKWNRLSVIDALRKVGFNIEDIQDIKDFQRIAKEKGFNISEGDDWEMIFELVFAQEIEPLLDPNKPTFVYDYPKQLCPLTRLRADNPLIAQKVELYMAGKEIANGYTELTDGFELEKNFREEEAARKAIGKEPIIFDNELVDALKSGLPEVAGIGMGIDRIAAIYANTKSIADVNYFPWNESF